MGKPVAPALAGITKSCWIAAEIAPSKKKLNGFVVGPATPFTITSYTVDVCKEKPGR